MWIEPYSAFQKHANSDVQKPLSLLRFPLPSIKITITSNLETRKHTKRIKIHQSQSISKNFFRPFGPQFRLKIRRAKPQGPSNGYVTDFWMSNHAFYNPGQSSLDISMCFVISRHTTIISNGNKVAPPNNPCSKLFGLKAHVCISGVTTNKIGTGEGGGTVFHFATVSFLVRTSAKNRYFVIGFNSFCPRL